jgi:hypothetical protein
VIIEQITDRGRRRSGCRSSRQEMMFSPHTPTLILAMVNSSSLLINVTSRAALPRR